MLDTRWLTDLLSPFGTPSVRRMFGGQGIYLDGLMIGLGAAGVFYLKSDDQTAAAFDAAGLEAFAFRDRDGGSVSTSYRRAPAEALDDPEAMRPWIEDARQAAMRAAARRRKRPPRRAASR